MRSRPSLTHFLTSLSLILIFPIPFSSIPATRATPSPHPDPVPQNIAVHGFPAVPSPIYSRALVLDSRLFLRDVGHSRFPLKRTETALLGDCGAAGPFPGDEDPIVTVVCEAGRMVTCQATDLTGCQAGDPTNVVSLVVSNFETKQDLGGSASVVDATFTCPDTGLAKCSLVLKDQSFGAMYGMRAFYVNVGGVRK